MAKKQTATKASAKQPPAAPNTAFLLPGFWAQHGVAIAAILLIPFVLYGFTLGFGYLQDDQLFIWDNAFVQKGFAGLGEIFGHDSMLGYYKDPAIMLEGGRYRPLPLATFAIEIGFFGKDCTAVAHFTNVLLYGLTSLLLYRVLVGLFPVAEGGRWYSSLPFLATLFFLFHPLHVEVVANIKSRDEILALLGSLGALYGMLQYFDTQENRWKWVAAGSFLAGLLSKENTTTFLAVIPLVFWFFSRVSLGRVFSAMLPMFGMGVLYLVLRLLALETPIEHPDEMVLNPFFGMSFPEKSATIFVSLGWMFKLLWVPHPLTIDYYPYHVPKVTWSDWRALLSLVLYVGMAIWAYRALRKARSQSSAPAAAPAFSVLYFLVTISVVSNILVQTSTFLSERFLFMPSIGFCVLVAWFLTRKLPEWMKKGADLPHIAMLSLGIMLLAGYAYRTVTRVADWGGDGSRLVESAIKVSSESYRANYYYANLLYQNKYLPLANPAETVPTVQQMSVLNELTPYLDKSLKINPGYRLAAPLKIQTAVAQFNRDKNLDKLLKEIEQLILQQPANGEMLTMALDLLKSLKGSDPNVYNFFCHRVGYNFYFVKRNDPNGAAEFLNLALTNFPDGNTLQDLIQVYTAMGNTAKVREMQQRMRQ